MKSWLELTKQEQKEIQYLEHNYTMSLLDIYQKDELIKFIYLKQDHSIVAFVSLKKMEEGYDIYNFIVQKEFQNLALGTTILNKIKEFKETKSIILEVNSTNQQAINFYEKNKFKKIKELKNYYPNNKSAYVMLFKQTKKPLQ